MRVEKNKDESSDALASALKRILSDGQNYDNGVYHAVSRKITEVLNAVPIDAIYTPEMSKLSRIILGSTALVGAVIHKKDAPGFEKVEGILDEILNLIGENSEFYNKTVKGYVTDDDKLGMVKENLGGPSKK